MMATPSWRQCTEILLLQVTCCLLVLPFITCQFCHYTPQDSAPLVEISASPSTQPWTFGSSRNLTCTARLTDDLRWTTYNDSRPSLIEWFNAQGNLVRECKAVLSLSTVMTCTLELGALAKISHHYTCQASNRFSLCTMKRQEIHSPVGILRPNVVPLNQSARTGSNVTFTCRVSGNPKPTVIWAKGNNSHILQANLRVQTITDINKGESQLVITGITADDYGNYHCIGENIAGARRSKTALLYPETRAIQGPQFVEDPQNQSAVIQSNVTFSCKVTGYPKPTISWTKDNDSHFLQSNPRAKVVTDIKRGRSHVVIAGVNTKDYGQYRCVARNAAGVKRSRVGILYKEPSISIPTAGNLVLVPTASKRSNAKIIGIIIPSLLVAMIICGIIALGFYRRSRRPNETSSTGITVVPIPSTDLVEEMSLEAEDAQLESTAVQVMKAENPYDTIDTLAPPTRAKELDRVQLMGPRTDLYRGTFHFHPQRRELLPTPNIEDSPPGRPPKPRKKGNARQEIVCACMLQSKRQTLSLNCNPRNSKDSGFDSTESRESIFTDPDSVLDVERKSSISSQSYFEETEESWEIDLKRLEVRRDEILGEGEFGVVYKGRYYRKGGQIEDVAVKQLKDSPSESGKSDLLSEIKMLKQAGRHANIVSLIGASAKNGEVLVITELIPGGSLESFLRTKRIEFIKPSIYENEHFGLNDRQLLLIALQIANGMCHLVKKKCIHRDLAARNVFLDAKNVAKVGDFGMARDITDDGIYRKTSSGKVPWRWTSLESLENHVYTHQSDVWSYGVLLWEIATYGEEPYPSINTPRDLITFLSSGSRMIRPEHCPEEMYELMSACWKENPSERKKFVDIANQLNFDLREYKRPYENIQDHVCTEMIRRH